MIPEPDSTDSFRKDRWDELDEQARAVKMVTSPQHVIDRVKERYDLDMTLEEYHALLASKTFRTKFKKNWYVSIGIVPFKEKSLWLVYNRLYTLFTTALPPVIEHDVEEMAAACFSRAVRPVALTVLAAVQEELGSARRDFSTNKEAALHYIATSPIPMLLMNQFKHGTPAPWVICGVVKNIITGKHDQAGLGLVRKV